MATKKKPSSGDRTKVKDMLAMSWVMNNLNDKEILAVDATDFDAERFTDFMEKCVDSGLDVKMGWDNYSKSYQVTAMGSWQGFNNESIACSARGVTIFDAWKILWFKIDVIADWDLRQFVNQSGERSKRG